MTIIFIYKELVCCIVSFYILVSQESFCSLLSRFKNRYEYIPQGRSTDAFTEDLYDFEFTNTDPIVTKKVYLETYATLGSPDKKKHTISFKSIAKLDTKSDMNNEISQLNLNISAKLKHLWDHWSLTSSLKFRPTIMFNLNSENSTTQSKETSPIIFPSITMSTTQSEKTILFIFPTNTVSTRRSEKTRFIIFPTNTMSTIRSQKNKLLIFPMYTMPLNFLSKFIMLIILIKQHKI